GTGKTYITSALTYYVSENRKEIGETEYGFDVEREYYTLKRVFHKKQELFTYKKQPFTGVVKSGDELLVKVKVYPYNRENSFFMLEDPLPSGCASIQKDWAYPIEGENSYLGQTSDSWGWWYADKEVRDNRVIFFASYLDSREYEFSYLLRAEPPGTYNIMPSRGMLMYYPEINGSSSNMTLRITD